MTAMPRTTKRRWAAAGAGALVAGVLGAVLFRQPPARPVVSSKTALPVQRTVTLLSEADKTVTDESVLLDPTPLFLPTKWNATRREPAPPEPGGRFQGYDAPRVSFTEGELKLRLPEAITVPAGAAEAVTAHAASAVLTGFGRADVPVVAPESRGAFIEIVAAVDGRSFFAQAIPGGPPGKHAWQPVEFMAKVDAAGLVGPLVVATRSGVEEVDGYFANYLVRTLRVGERLPPGFYRISVGP